MTEQDRRSGGGIRGGMTVPLLAAFAVLAALVGAWLLLRAAAADRDPSTTAADVTSRVPMRLHVSEGWIGWQAEVTIERRMTVSDALVHYGGATEPGGLWLDDESPFDDIPVEPGDHVVISGGVMPDCTPGAPVEEASLSMVERAADGTSLRHGFLPARPLDLASGIHEWCAQEPSVTAGSYSLTPEGDAVISISVINPGPGPVRLEVPAYSDEHVDWEPLDVSAPPAEWSHFEIRGANVGCEPGEIASWADGRLLLDGEPYVVAMDDAWC